jgi:hypothetical protein
MRRRKIRGFFVPVLVCFGFLADPVQGDEKRAVIVSTGGNAPDTLYLSRNVDALERVPLDGVGVWIATPVPVQLSDGVLETPRVPSGRLARVPGGADAADVGQTLVHRRKIPLEHIAPAIEDLKSVQFKRFASNFINCITGNAPGPMDWFDDEWWEIICHNGAMLARVAKEGGCKGLLLDPEVYSYSWWSYPMLTETQTWEIAYRRGDKDLYAGKSFEQVSAKVRQRGREFASGLNSEYPDITLMLYHGSGWAATQINDPRWDSLEEIGFGLFVPFLDGLLEGSTDQTSIVDCTSQAKWWTKKQELLAARKLVKEDGAELSDVPDLYRRKVRLGFCYRLAYHPREEEILGDNLISGLFDSARPESNFFSPRRLEEALKLALEIGDGYILFWNPRANWWLDSPEARPANGAPMSKYSHWVPRDYWPALERARESLR